MDELTPVGWSQRSAWLIRAATLAVAAGLIGMTALSVFAASEAIASSSRPDLVIAGNDPWNLAGILPGDPAAPHEIHLRAVGDLRYDLRAELDGSALLADELRVVVRAGAAGATLFDGPLSGLAAPDEPWAPGSGRLLRDAAEETLLVSVALPAGVGNEVQGTRLRLRLVFATSGDLAALDR
jgi:hypothetical protein